MPQGGCLVLGGSIRARFSVFVLVLALTGSIMGTTAAAQLAVPGSSLAPVPYDEFGDGITDPLKWDGRRQGNGATYTEVNTQLEVSLGPGASNGSDGVFNAGYRSRCTVVGDFDLRVDFKVLNNWQGGVRAGLSLEDLTGSVQRTGGGYLTHTWYGGVSGITGNNDQSGTLRLTRTAGNAQGYYLSGLNWVPISSGYVGEGDTRFAIGAWSHDGLFSGSTKIAFDNMLVGGSLDCASPNPTVPPDPVPTPEATLPPVEDPCDTAPCDPPPVDDPCDTAPCDPPPTDPCDVAPCDPPIDGICPPGCAPLLTTPPGQVLVLDANVMQGNMKSRYGGSGSCPNLVPGNSNYEGMKSCDAAGRQARFAQRVRTLSEKLVETGGVAQDGMGFAPDILTLQELYGQDARSIRDLLNAATGYTMDYRVAISDETLSPSAEEDNNAILYSYRTMQKIDDGGALVTSGGGAPSRGHFFMGFREVVPETSTPGLSIGVASVHFPLHHEFDSEAVAEEKKAQWSRAIAAKLEVMYGVNPAFPTRAPADRMVIAGDFNSSKCGGDLPDEGEPVDAYAGAGVLGPEDATCVPRQFWTDLAQAGYVDTINAANAATIKEQYRDGNDLRSYRIDHIFSKGPNSYLGASFDVSCGANGSTNEARQSCKWLQSPERYSDHRLLWALTGFGSP